MVEKKEIKSQKIPQKPQIKKQKVIEGVRGIVHIAETDLDGTKKVSHALLKIKGISHALARAIPYFAGINHNELLGKLSDEQLEKLEDVILNPVKYGIPSHLLNRRSDPFTGEVKHLVASELTITTKSDIDFMKKIRCYKGIRHELGLPVRGQRTRSSFRKGILVGVTKKKQQTKQASQETKQEKPAEKK
ncbi:MAG: 30S ribosomal protein S13 [Candidatus Aenigmatarchaeota archaeon]|nr:30S ribosomal protein S13 [Candidatus Aenigmarchaeota archaeon]